MKRSSSSDVDQRPLLPEDGTSDHSDLDVYLAHSRRAVQGKHSRILVILLVLSSTLNVSLITGVFIGLFSHQQRSTYAQLDTSLTVAFQASTEYSNPNLTEASALWEAINFDAGIVALPTSWARQKSLPQGHAFVWDESKELYVLNGHHQMHCLKNIYRSLKEFKEGLNQSLPMEHITHCFDSLRSDIICHADDTPRYAPGTLPTGVGQHRQCRDWNALEEWARARTACYNYIGPKANGINQFKRFQFCPKDSPYWPAVRAHFGKPDDWFGEDDDEIKAARVY